jgi:hypothetical protein
LADSIQHLNGKIDAFGFVASLAFGLVFAYLTIVTGRWLYGRKEL